MLKSLLTTRKRKKRKSPDLGSSTFLYSLPQLPSEEEVVLYESLSYLGSKVGRILEVITSLMSASEGRSIPFCLYKSWATSFSNKIEPCDDDDILERERVAHCSVVQRLLQSGRGKQPNLPE